LLAEADPQNAHLFSGDAESRRAEADHAHISTKSL